MASRSPPAEGSSEGSSDFVHQIAIEVSLLFPPLVLISETEEPQLSRMMNAINPNDLLAKRVIDIAQYNRTGNAFIKGKCCQSSISPECVRLTDWTAVSAFGKFPEETVLSLHTRILAQLAVEGQNGNRRGSGHSPPRMIGAKGAGGDKANMTGMDHDHSDVLAAEPRRKGGLVRSDNVRSMASTVSLVPS